MAAIVVTANVDPINGMIFHDLDPSRAELLQIFISHSSGAVRVENGVDFYAGASSLGQCVGEFTSDLTVPENVGLKRDRMFGGANRAEHGGKNLLAVHKCDHIIAGDKIRAEQ